MEKQLELAKKYSSSLLATIDSISGHKGDHAQPIDQQMPVQMIETGQA
eukprot:CAMPEP_0185599360 /NCGR_PEP_ID=MMETSP0434-20130131/82654_1 /TAXON_ID=626734 ORGANISM="Favella taraikaensis, Strain Fe Narragansett Bay" /NCGR_SAMPLE_ID=MMETSP0434 /ASSEMBLY_ACC=CAM_ASM_000379 /LENGTH=47 /DNA_ID= /DNA_START= /DNA_END= /DNA_ORIENTATION=